MKFLNLRPIYWFFKVNILNYWKLSQKKEKQEYNVVQLFLWSRRVKTVVIHLAFFPCVQTCYNDLSIDKFEILNSNIAMNMILAMEYFFWRNLLRHKAFVFGRDFFCFLYNYQFLKSVLIISVHSGDRIINPRLFSIISHIDHTVGYNLTLICIQNINLYTCNKHEMIFKR